MELPHGIAAHGSRIIAEARAQLMIGVAGKGRLTGAQIDEDAVYRWAAIMYDDLKRPGIEQEPRSKDI